MPGAQEHKCQGSNGLHDSSHLSNPRSPQRLGEFARSRGAGGSRYTFVLDEEGAIYG